MIINQNSFREKSRLMNWLNLYWNISFNDVRNFQNLRHQLVSSEKENFFKKCLLIKFWTVD